MTVRGRAVFLTVLMALTPVLAGCLGGSDEGGDPLVNESADNETGPGGLPEGRDGEFAAFKETNETEEGSGGMAHDHDYWQGRSRVRLFEEHAKIYPEPDANGEYTAIFRPPIGTLVYEGTATIEVTILNPSRHACEPADELNGQHVCTDNLDYYGAPTALPTVPDPSPPELTLKFLHGASNPNEWEDAGPMQWDVPLGIQVPDPRWTDMPHSTASLWTFKFVSNGVEDSTLVFDVAVDLVRAEGEEIPEWPGHPDFYADTCCRKILSASGTYAETAGETTTTPDYTVDKLISYGTRTLYVWANVSSVSGGTPAEMPSHIFLNFHNASAQTWNITSPRDANHTSDVKEHLWILHVDDNAMDTPYATQSRWEFIVQGSHTVPPEPSPRRVSCYGECFTYSISYTIDIVATNEVLDGSMYDRPSASIPVR